MYEYCDLKEKKDLIHHSGEIANNGYRRETVDVRIRPNIIQLQPDGIKGQIIQIANEIGIKGYKLNEAFINAIISIVHPDTGDGEQQPVSAERRTILIRSILTRFNEMLPKSFFSSRQSDSATEITVLRELFPAIEGGDSAVEAKIKNKIYDKFLSADLIPELESSHIYKEGNLLDILRLLNSEKKQLFVNYIKRIVNISTAEGIGNVINSACDNVSPDRKFLNLETISGVPIELPAAVANNYTNAFIKRLELMINFIVEVSHTEIPGRGGQTYGGVYFIDSTGSDPHTGGKHALFLVNKSTLEKERVYKPRTLASDSLVSGNGADSLPGMFNSLMGDVETDSLPEGISPGDIGFASMEISNDTHTEEMVSKQKEMTNENALKYCFNVGMLEVVARIFGYLDLHRDNIMAVGYGESFAPLIIDAECAFVRRQTTGLWASLTSFGGNSEFMVTNPGQNMENKSIIELVLSNGTDNIYKTKVIEGFQFMKRFVSGHKEIIKNRLDENASLNSIECVRFVPYATGMLGRALHNYQKCVDNAGKNEYIASLVNIGIGEDRSKKKLLDILNTSQFFFYNGGRITINNQHETNLKICYRKAFDNGTIPLFEYDLKEGNILCDAAAGASPDSEEYLSSVVAVISSLEGDTRDIRQIMIDVIKQKIDEVDSLNWLD